MRFANGTGTPSIKTVLAGNNSWVVQALEACNPGGRLSLTSGTAVTMSDVTGTATLYYIPYTHDQIALYNTVTGGWEVQTFTQQSLSLSALTSNVPADIFATNNNNGTFTLTATSWSSVSARATSLAILNGVLVNSSNTGGLYLGTTHVLTGTTSDAVANRLVWNNYNRVRRKILATDAATTTYTLVGATGGTFQYSRAVSTTIQANFVIGQAINELQFLACNYASSVPLATACAVGINIALKGSTALTNLIDWGTFFTSPLTGNSSASQAGLIYNPTAPGIYSATQLDYAKNGTVTFSPGTNAGPSYASLSGTTWC